MALKITNIKSKILALQEIGNVENTLDYIFDTIDTIVGILTITHTCKNELVFRNSFYQLAYNFVNKLYLTEETNQILVGLE